MRWTSVKDSLPSLHKETSSEGLEYLVSMPVLAYHINEYGGHCAIVAMYEQDDNGYYYTGWADAQEGVQLGNVTHWMPIQEPPED